MKDKGYPTNDHISKDGLLTNAIRAASVVKPETPIKRRTNRVRKSSFNVLVLIHCSEVKSLRYKAQAKP